MVFFGRMSKLFRIMNMKGIYSIEEFKNLFENTAKESNCKNVHFKVIRRKNREGKIYKVGIKNLKLYLAYLFMNDECYYAYLTNCDRYDKMEAEDIEEIDKRETKRTPDRADNMRIQKYMNDKIYTIYSKRTS